MKIEIIRTCMACGGKGINPDRKNEICHSCGGSGEWTQEFEVKQIIIKD